MIAINSTNVGSKYHYGFLENLEFVQSALSLQYGDAVKYRGNMSRRLMSVNYCTLWNNN